MNHLCLMQAHNTSHPYMLKFSKTGHAKAYNFFSTYLRTTLAKKKYPNIFVPSSTISWEFMWSSKYRET